MKAYTHSKWSLAFLALLIFASFNMNSLILSTPGVVAQESSLKLPSDPLKFGVFDARFDPGGTFTLKGDRWPALNGNWKGSGTEIELTMSGGPDGCDEPGRYRVRIEGNRIGFDLVSDKCQVRALFLSR